MLKSREYLSICNCLLLILVLWISNNIATYGQCPLIENSAITPACNQCIVCPNTKFSFEIGGIDLPDGGTMDWYTGTFPNFDPSKGEGTLIGSTGIANPDPTDCSPCPSILAIFLDACNGNGSEADNEFMCISSGGGFNVNSLQINLNNNDSQGNNDIQLGDNPCDFQIPSAELMANILNDAGCNGSNIYFVGPGDVVPAEAIAIVFTSAGENFDYNFGTLCATGQPIYILQNSCTRIMNIGAFTNFTSTGTRTYSISLIDCPFCSHSLTYDTDNPALSGDGDFVYMDLNGQIHYENNGCAAPPVSSIALPPVSSVAEVFEFTFDASYCSETYGGPVYVVGVLNPQPLAPCPAQLSSYFSFQMNCPVTSLARTLCFGDSLVINGNSYSENNPSGQEILATQSGCDSIVQISLSFGNKVIYDYAGSICAGDTIMIGGQSFYEGNLIGNVLIPNGAAAGCDSLINVSLSLKENITFLVQNASCQYDKGKLIVNGPTGANGSILLNKNSYPFSSLPFEIDSINPNFYAVEYFGPADVCSDRIYFTIEVPVLDSVQISVDSSGKDLGIYQLQFVSDFPFPYTINWLPADVFGCPACPNSSATLNESTLIAIQLTNPEGCVVSDSVLIKIISDQDVFIPSGFSPNGDATNDYFNVFSVARSVRKIERMSIFNRWGAVVYEGQDILPNSTDSGWDGYFKGRLLPQAVYVYLIELVLFDGVRLVFSGDVVLIN